ncbi:MAG TPA: methyltransferase domain-containing protein [Nitrospirales bacterium]|nr:methyltransferase domain-containing protein [Nitrospirales bacterium]
MNKRLLELLRCPCCRGRLTPAEMAATADGTITGGTLICGCGRQYAIRDGVPRMVNGTLASGTTAVRRTQAAFGYEWTRFDAYAADNFPAFITPLPHGFFAGRLGLDAGCGAGRHAERACQLGAEMVGVDLSDAVDVAARRAATHPSLNIVQGNLLALPFPLGTFDFIYSLGVLHHLPDPEAGFRSLVPYLKPGGRIFIWVYQRTRRKQWLEYARAVTTRLPLAAVQALSWAAAAVDYGIVVNLYRALKWIPAAERRTPLRIKEYARYDFYTAATDWFDRLAAPISHFYDAEDIRRWFTSAGLTQVETALVEDSWVWGIGTQTPCTS